MKRRLRLVGGVVAGTCAAAVTVSGCGSQASPSGDAAPRAVLADKAIPAGNRAATRSEADRLLSLAPIPENAGPLGAAPASDPGPALGTPATGSLIDRTRYWRDPWPVTEVYGRISQVSPHGLHRDGSSSGSGPGTGIADGVEWSEPDTSYAIGLTLGVNVWTDPHGGSFIRADGMAEWLDPRPIRVTLPPAERLHVTVAAGCPDSDAGKAGVSAPADRAMAHELLPAGPPSGGVVCVYGGSNSPRVRGLVRTVSLSPDGATRLATRVRGLRLSHTNGDVMSCPAEDGSATVAALSYADHPDVDLWLGQGCGNTSNGRIAAASNLTLPKTWRAPSP